MSFVIASLTAGSDPGSERITFPFAKPPTARLSMAADPISW
jgi:hypothetical protein